VATTRPQEVEGALIESVCARVRERLGEDEAPRVEEFVRQYYRRVPPEDLAELDPLDVYGAALAHWSFARQREPGTVNVRVYNPDFEQHGWQSAHTVVELVSDDMPVLVDSTTMELSGQGAGIHMLIHPVIRVRRQYGRVVHPRRDRSRERDIRARASAGTADRRPAPGLGGRRGLARDAGPGRRPHRRAA
jgi:NAD-specific glutamate dehydrogenase